MMENIKSWVIHRLGGFTLDEALNSNDNAFRSGQETALVYVKVFADRMNGTPADDWCKRMYVFLISVLERVKKGDYADEPERT